MDQGVHFAADEAILAAPSDFSKIHSAIEKVVKTESSGTR
jgi:hypothetical protein